MSCLVVELGHAMCSWSSTHNNLLSRATLLAVKTHNTRYVWSADAPAVLVADSLPPQAWKLGYDQKNARNYWFNHVTG